MTRFDVFIRNMILHQLHLMEDQVTPHQSQMIDLMIKELYQNERFASMNVESRVEHLVTTYQKRYPVY